MGRSGLKLSALSFGSWVTFANQLDLREAQQCLATAYDAGVNFFDNAEAYAAGESERIMGQALAKLGWPRDSYVVSSKVYFGSRPSPLPTQRGLSRKHVFEACHQALQRLQLDYLDLFFCHRSDPETPVEETVRAMDALVRRGDVLYWGTSEWPAHLIAEAFEVAREHGLTPPAMEQPQYSLLSRDRVEQEYPFLFERFGLGTTIWSPLRSGILTGKYRDGIPTDSRMALSGYEWLRRSYESEKGQRQQRQVARLAELAQQLEISLAGMAIAWCLKNPHVSTVILGASRIEQLVENLRALEWVERLDDQVMEAIEHCLQAP